jgi:hypothetical protein
MATPITPAILSAPAVGAGAAGSNPVIHVLAGNHGVVRNNYVLDGRTFGSRLALSAGDKRFVALQYPGR